MNSRSSKASALGSVMKRVAAALSDRNLTVAAAAKMIGVGAQTLQNHLAGEHIRSDSAHKYENWLAGRVGPANVFALPTRHLEDQLDEEEALPPAPDTPRLVVDIFSGCGGLSLGFDLLGGGTHFRTILAIDNQAAPIKVLNRNAELLGHDGNPIGRQIDLTEFMNEAEFLAFYIQHAAKVSEDRLLLEGLHAARGGAFPAFLSEIAAADHDYMVGLNRIREGSTWRRAYESLDRQSLNQTSVVGFHEKLRLPKPGLKAAGVPAVLWTGKNLDIVERAVQVDSDYRLQAAAEWDEEVTKISDKREASGRGQLTASARRVSAFVNFLSSPGMADVRDVWIGWRARRLMLRTSLFGDEGFCAELRKLYEARCPVSVLVGGPPCQGFSRIGRGKIRSLRDARVQVHGNAEAGDARNLLFLQYVMVLGALRPEVFLFENVQHFQSTVKADGVEFEATEVLAEAIANMSEGEVTYGVSSRILDASRHGVPQTRQRYFMAGVLATNGIGAAASEATDCLSLRRLQEASLGLALAGLSEPAMVGGEVTGGDAMATRARAAEMTGDLHPFVQWIRRPLPGTAESPHSVDGHAARAARSDDAAFFALMGPGKRWMDYRADDSETVRELRNVLDALLAIPTASYKEVARATLNANVAFPDRETLADLRNRVDGSLPLRLLLEQAGKKLGAPHHLLAEGYLSKRDGHHGDWVARMDASRPAKTMVSHMGKDTYAYVHPAAPRTISVREAARIQSFPDWFELSDAALTDAFKMIGNAVPPMLSHAIAGRVSKVIHLGEVASRARHTRKRTAT